MDMKLAGRTALVIDDVIDTGLSLSEAHRLVRDAGASRVLTAVFGGVYLLWLLNRQRAS